VRRSAESEPGPDTDAGRRTGSRDRVAGAAAGVERVTGTVEHAGRNGVAAQPRIAMCLGASVEADGL
jgi:hypothetical protein